MLGLVAIVAQGCSHRDALTRVHLRRGGIASQALCRDWNLLAEAEDQSCRDTEGAYRLRTAGQIVGLQRALIGVHIAEVGLSETEGNVIARVGQLKIHTATTCKTVAPGGGLGLGPGHFCAAGDEVYERDDVLTDKEAIDGPRFDGVEGVGDPAELHKWR